MKISPEPEKPQQRKTTDHMANERTFLAWVRTGIATVSLGFVIARFSFWLREIVLATGRDINVPRTSLSLPIGLGMIGFGALMTFMAALRYRAINHAIEHDLPHPDSRLIIITTAAVMLLSVILILYLLLTAQQF